MSLRLFVRLFPFLSLACTALLSALPAAAQTSGDDPGLYTFVRLGPPSAKTAGAAKIAATATVATSDTFEGFVRYPAEEQFFLNMPTDATGPFAYFRDFFTGGETFADGANDGDTLGVKFTTPSGGGSSLTLTFHSTFNGQQDCWVGGSPAVTLCGSQSVDIIWYANTQCGPTIGNYSASFSRNGANYFSGNFRLEPTINPDKLTAITAPTYNQVNYPNDQYGDFCWKTVNGKKKTVRCSTITTPDPPKATIKQLGCLLTAYAATLTYHGLSTTPTALNTWLKDNGGFDGGGAIIPDKVKQYAHDNDLNLEFRRTDGTPQGSEPTGATRTAICSKGLTPIKVQHHDNNNNLHYHFVAAWGRPDTENSYKLKDPNGGQDRDLSSTTIPFDYRNLYFGTRELEGTGFTFTFPGGIQLTLHSPAELLLTNPSGLRTGIDPSTNATFAEIPGATYGDDSFQDPDDDTGDPVNVEAKVLELRQGAPGTYSLTVTGTGSGTYDLEFNALDPSFQSSHSEVDEVPVSPGSKQTYSFTLPISPGSAFPLAGGFNGGGQRPRDVNHFLSYANPSSSQTDLPAGTTSVPLIIFYGARALAGTFSATLEGADVSGLFNPSPGGFERVDLPVHSGRNVLQLSIDGNLPNRVATDSDHLVFSVP